MGAMSGLTLYKLESDLEELINGVEEVTPDQEEAFLARFAEALELTKEKRDRVHQFLTHCETMEQAAEDESERLRLRAQMFANARRRVEQMCVNVIVRRGVDAKGKYSKLEGDHVVMGVAKNPRKVELLGEDQIPDRYKVVKVEMRKDHFETLLSGLDIATLAVLEPLFTAKKVEVRLTDVKRDLDDKGEGVPGATLSNQSFRLTRK